MLHVPCRRAALALAFGSLAGGMSGCRRRDEPARFASPSPPAPSPLLRPETDAATGRAAAARWPRIVQIEGTERELAGVARVHGAYVLDHGQHALGGGRWRMSAHVDGPAVVDGLRALGLAVSGVEAGAPPTERELERDVAPRFGVGGFGGRR